MSPNLVTLTVHHRCSQNFKGRVILNLLMTLTFMIKFFYNIADKQSARFAFLSILNIY